MAKLLRLGATQASIIGRVFTLVTQALSLLVLRNFHTQEDQALFFIIQTLIGLQFLAEAGASQALIQRMRATNGTTEVTDVLTYYKIFSVFSSVVYFAIIEIVWSIFYSNKFQVHNQLVTILSLAASLKLISIYIEASIEGQNEIAIVYRMRLISSVTSQSILLAGLCLTKSIYAFIFAMLAYFVSTIILAYGRTTLLSQFYNFKLNRISVLLAESKKSTPFQLVLLSSALCGYIIFNGPVVLSSIFGLSNTIISNTGTSMLIASVASTMCGALIAPNAVRIIDLKIAKNLPLLKRVEKSLLYQSLFVYASFFLMTIAVRMFHLAFIRHTVPDISKLAMPLIGYFFFTATLIYSYALRAEGKDKVFLPSLAAAVATLLLSFIFNYLSVYNGFIVFFISQVFVFFPMVFAIRHYEMVRYA